MICQTYKALAVVLPHVSTFATEGEEVCLKGTNVEKREIGPSLIGWRFLQKRFKHSE